MMLIACMAGVLQRRCARRKRSGHRRSSRGKGSGGNRSIDVALRTRPRHVRENAYAATYAPDGTFGTGAEAVTGREALKKVVADIKKRHAEEEKKTGQMTGRCITSSPTRHCSFWIRIMSARTTTDPGFEGPREGCRRASQRLAAASMTWRASTGSG
jgi:hypothetical protein